MYRLRQAWPQAMESGVHLFEAPGGRKAATAQMLAELAERSQDLDAALKWTREWRKLSPGAVPAILKEARLLRMLGREGEMLKALRLASGQFEGSREIQVELARAYRDEGRAADAIVIYARLYEQASDNSEKLSAVHEWAAAALEAGRLTELLDQFEERRRRNRAGTGPLLALAEVHHVSGDIEKQLSVLSEAAQLRPEDTALVLKLASIQEENDHLPQAIATLKNALPYDKSGKVRARLAGLCFATGDEMEGARLLKEEGTENTMDSAALESLVLTLADANSGRARTLLQLRLGVEPDNYRLRYLLAALLKENDEDEEALRAWSQLLSVKTENPALTNHGLVPRHGPPLEQKLQQLTGVVPDEILTVLRTHETAVDSGAPPVISAIPLVKKLFSKRLFREPPDSIAELQAMTVVALIYAFEKSPDQIREAAKEALRREGRGPLVELLSRLPNGSLLSQAYGRHRETSDEPFPDFADDTGRGLHALLMLDIANLSVRRDCCEAVWRKWKGSHPDFALAAALAGMGQGKGEMEEWEMEAINRLETVERPSPLILSAAERFVEGDRSLFGNFAQTGRIMNRIASWLEAPWMGAPAMEEFRRRLTVSIITAADRVRLDGGTTVYAPEGNAACLARVLDAEWPREDKNRNAPVPDPASVFLSNGSSLRLVAPPPPPLITPFSWPPQFITGVSPVFTGHDLIGDLTAARARRTFALVKTPALRALLEDRSEVAKHPLPALMKTAADPAADSATLTLAAVSAAEAEKFEEAGELAVRALALPLSPEVRRLLHASLLSWAEDGMAPPGSSLHKAACSAALRLQNEARKDDDRLALSGAMDSLGMMSEAAALNAGSGSAVTRARLLYSFRGKEGIRALRLTLMGQAAHKRYSSLVPLSRFLQRHARFLLSPAGWASVEETIAMKDNSFDRSIEYVSEILKDLKEQDKEERMRILAETDPGAEAGAKRLAVFAAVNEIMENREQAIKLYYKALSEGSGDAGVRVRLGLLLWNAGDEAVKDVFAAAEPEAQSRLLEAFLGEQKGMPPERIRMTAEMALAGLEKGGSAAAVEYESLNHLAVLLQGRLVDEELRKSLCRAMLKIPGAAAPAFTFLQDYLTPEARRVDYAVTACIAESRYNGLLPPVSFPRLFHCNTMGSEPASLRALHGMETPLIFLLETAMKNNNPELLQSSLIPALQNAGSGQMAKRTAFLTDLYFNPPEQVEATVKRLLAAGGEALWKPAIRILARRHIKIDLSGLLLPEISRARNRPDSMDLMAEVMTDYCEWQCTEGGGANVCSLLRHAVDLLAGPPTQRSAAIGSVLPDSHKGIKAIQPGGWSIVPGNGAKSSVPVLALLEALKRLVKSPPCVLAVLETLDGEIIPYLSTESAAELAVALNLDHADFTKPGYFLDPDRVRFFFKGNPMLAGVEDFRSWGGEGGTFMLVVEAMQLMSSPELGKVIDFLRQLPAAFGRDLLIAVTVEQSSGAPVDSAAVHLERIKALPEERRREMVSFLSALFVGRDRSKLTSEGVALLKWIEEEEAGFLHDDRVQNVQTWLNPQNIRRRASEAPAILGAAIATRSELAYEVVRRTAQIAGSDAAGEIANLLSDGLDQNEPYPLPPDHSAFRLGVLTNTLCAGDRRVPLFTDSLRAAVRDSAAWIWTSLKGGGGDRFEPFVRLLSSCVKENEASVMLEAFPSPALAGLKPEERAALCAAAVAWANGAGKEMPRQDIVHEINAAAALERSMAQRPGAAGIAEEMALPPEQAHYLSVMRDESVSSGARTVVASLLADRAGPWLEPPLLAEAATLLENSIAARRPLDEWQRRAIILAVTHGPHSPGLEEAVLRLRKRIPSSALDLRNENSRRQGKECLLLSLRGQDHQGAAGLAAELEKEGPDLEVLAMVLREGHAETIADMLRGAGVKFYDPARISGVEVFDQSLAKALEASLTSVSDPFAKMQAELAVNRLPSATGMPSRRDRLSDIARRLPAILDSIAPLKRDQLLELLAVEPVVALSVGEYYVAATDSSSLEALLRLNKESVSRQQLKFWMVLLCASAAQGNISEMSDRFNALTQLSGGDDSSPNNEALYHVCLGIAYGWPQWSAAKQAVVRDWLVRHRHKAALFLSGGPAAKRNLELLPVPLREALGGE
jgi:tetratricopeptide (TPR) repeat protein